MDFGFSKEELDFGKEVFDYLQKEMTEPVAVECRHWRAAAPGGPYTREFLNKVGNKGWLTPSWPKEYGGLGLPIIYSYIANEKMDYFNIRPPISSSVAGPLIMRCASPELKNKFLPRIARGEVHFALGYTEPQAGSDLSAVDIRAVKTDKGYVLNGQKMFSTHSHIADYHWLLARTNSEVKPRHKGITLFIVDLKSPGISISPIWTMADERTNEVFYENVLVPAENLVGQENRGFYYIMEDLEYERTFAVGHAEHILEQLIDYAKKTARDGKLLSSEPAIRQDLAQLAIDIEVGRLFFYRLADVLRRGTDLMFEGTVSKIFTSELLQREAFFGVNMMGLYGQLQEGSKWAPLEGNIEHLSRECVVESIYGGTNEICRNVIAMRALGLPTG